MWKLVILLSFVFIWVVGLIYIPIRSWISSIDHKILVILLSLTSAISIGIAICFVLFGLMMKNTTH